MSEDRLEKALQEMRHEDVDAGTLEAARARVWDKVTNAAGAGCAEFRPDFRAYLSGALGGSRRVLMEDHLSRCSACRASMAEMKGEQAGGRHAAAVLRPLDAMGNPGRGGRAGPVGPVSRTRRHRRHDGSWRSAGHGRVRRRRPVPPARRRARSRRLNRRTGSGPHGPRSARRVAARRRIDGGCQRANGAVRDHRLERPGHSPPARRRHRPGRETAPWPPARPDPRFDRLREGHRLRRVRRHGRLGGLGGGGIGGGEPARQGRGSQPRRAGRLESGTGDVGRGSRLLESRGGRVPGSCSPRSRRSNVSWRKLPGELRTSSALLPQISGRGLRLRRRPEPRREDRPGSGSGGAAGIREGRVRRPGGTRRRDSS